ncbi:MAG: hypothetical protein HKN26_07950 [Acidimicrobiales bacterium]|nr:hypothetical protein [Acidimicrobiales bacterium]
MPETTPDDAALRAARERRVELKGAVSAVEIAAASPIGDPSWRDNMARALDELRIALDQHIDEVEGPDGLLAELRDAAPRLSNKIAVVSDEHPALCRQVDDVIANLKESAALEQIRSDAIDALVAMARHRQKGADLVYEAYHVDIGGG